MTPQSGSNGRNGSPNRSRIPRSVVKKRRLSTGVPPQAGKWLNRSEQATLPLCIKPCLFFAGHVGSEFLGDMHGARCILPIGPEHPLQRLFDVAPLVSAEAIDRRSGLAS